MFVVLSGSCYAYSYAALGELPAVVAASFLTLEYGISCSAVARSWGDKFVYTTGIEWLEFGNCSIIAGQTSHQHD
jgi:amino acid transporter